MSERFAAPWGTSVTVTTVLGLAVIAVVAVGLTGLLGDADPGWLRWLVLLVLAAAVVVSALYAVTAYEIEGRTLRIHRPLWSTEVDLEGLRHVEHDPAALRWSLRLFGNGGLFAITGWYRNRKLGGFRAFVTAPRRAVVLRFDDRTLVISPESPARFVMMMRDRYGLHA